MEVTVGINLVFMNYPVRSLPGWQRALSKSKVRWRGLHQPQHWQLWLSHLRKVQLPRGGIQPRREIRGHNEQVQPVCLQGVCAVLGCVVATVNRIKSYKLVLCFIPVQSGTIQCTPVPCVPVTCSNPATPVGECCPRCIGSCQSNGMSYNNGAVFALPSDSCSTCTCSVRRGALCDAFYKKSVCCDGVSLQARNQRGAIGQLSPPPKYSKTYVFARYSNKFTSFCPPPPKRSVGCGPVSLYFDLQTVKKS